MWDLTEYRVEEAWLLEVAPWAVFDRFVRCWRTAVPWLKEPHYMFLYGGVGK